MADHDHSYKHLFSHPELIQDLLRGFVPGSWVEALDLDTLEKVNGSYVSADLREREDDIIWRVRCRHKWIYVYLLIEFQSTVDRYMAVRLLTYIGLLYQDITKAKQQGEGKLPPILPLVLYNGDKVWDAALTLEELIEELPGELSRYRPQFHYLLLDEGHYPKQNLPLNNLVASIFRLEMSREPKDVHRLVAELVDWLKAPEQASLRRAFAVWINRVLLPTRLPGQQVPRVNDLIEVENMLAERVKEWTREWKEAGIQEGMQKGIRKGIRKGLLEAIEMGLSIKFGAEGTRLYQRIERITDIDQLEAIKETVKTAKELAEIEVLLGSDPT
jgi:predicted transposase/invertase (TIGR01784 family)